MPPPQPLLPFPIPDSILLLTHLHLLQCPLQLEPNMFDPNIRGIGDRFKTMEHIVYFLMGQAEGQQRLKALLPMYPSKKPADALAFRNAVVKYLEGLRAVALKQSPSAKQLTTSAKSSVRNNRTPNLTGPLQAKNDTAKKPIPKRPPLPARSVSATIKSGHQPDPSSTTSRPPSTPRSVSAGAPKAATSHSNQGSTFSNGLRISTHPKSGNKATVTPIHGWWWRDVPVRKSLLEECTGPRFERLLLALSIHVLILHVTRKDSSDVLCDDALVGLNSASNLDMFSMLSEQPDHYRDLVQRLSALQLRMSEGEKNFVREKQKITSLRALIRSDLVANGNNQQSIQELRALVSNLTAKLGSSWRLPPDSEAAESHSDSHIDNGGDDLLLQWLFAHAGVLRHLGGKPSVGGDTGSSDSLEGKRPHRSILVNRKTILPAPPLPTAAAHRSSHLDTLRAANDKLSNLRRIHSSSPEENIIAENHEMETTIPTSSSVVYDSFVAEESTLSSTLKTFLLEIEELEDRLEKQLEIKQSLLVKAHKEHEQAVDGDNTVNHRKYFRHSELRNPSEAFRLDFEMQGTAILPTALSRKRRIPSSAEIANSIKGEIEDALREVRASLAAESQHYWEGFEEDQPIADPGEGSESDGGDIDDKTVMVHAFEVLESPAKPTRIPILSHTPKRNILPTRSRSTTKPAGLQQDNHDPTSKYTQSPSITTAAGRSFIQETPVNVILPQTPKMSKRRAQLTPPQSFATPSFFYSPGDGMENLKEILPPFQSPWKSVARSRRSPRKSSRLSIHRPRPSKGRLGSSSFTRTPLKSGKRLSNIVPPVSFSLAKPSQATPRASLDNVYEGLIDELVKSSSKRTPPFSMSARRLLDSKNNIRRSSPFKSLAGSGRAPLSPQSPDIGTEIIEEEDAQTADLPPGRAQLLSSNPTDDWEDVLEVADSAATAQRQMLTTDPMTAFGPRFSEGPSFTLRDMLLKVGQDGLMGMNGTFNFDLLQESEFDVEDDSVLDAMY